MKCSWKDCGHIGKHRQKATDGDEWAYLCDEHVAKVDGAVDAALKDPSEANIKALLGSWVRAQGGAKAATKRVLR
jgi:hypothetical protein